jgi:chitodextrinase
VSITAPTGGTTVAATLSVTAAASDNVGVTGVQFKLDGANLGAEVTTPPYTVSWLTTAASPGAHALTAVARDAAGNRTTSTAVTVTVAGGDTTPPTVSITGPTAGASVAGTVSVTATAADNIGVAGVQFQLDGANLGAEVTTAPYSVSWTSTTTTNATHALTAIARDAAGNRTTSTAVNVAVANGGGGGSSSLTTGLVGYWPFDEGSGSTASDASGSGNTGTLVSGPVWTAGRRGSALAFDGVASYVRVASTPALNSYPLTVAFWMKTASTSGIGGLVNKYADLSLNGWQVYMNAGRLCAWYVKDGANYVDDGGVCPLGVSGFNDNQWHQVAFVVDATGGKMYVDGVLRNSLGWTGTPGAVSTTQELHIGQYPGLASGGFFAGVIDDVRIWDPALSAADILALYTGAGDTTPPALSAISVSGVSASSATMNWMSNKAADTQIVYGHTPAHGTATPLNPALVISHSQVLSGLAPATTYHYQVKSRDAAGNLAVSGDQTFSTPAQAAPHRKHKKRSWLSDLFGGLF